MDPNTGAVGKFSSEEEARSAGYTVKVDADAASRIVALHPDARLRAQPRFKALEQAGVTVIGAAELAAVLAPRGEWRAFLSEAKRRARKRRR